MEKIELRKEWERRVASFRASGQTQSKWCEVNKVKIHQLKYWLKRIDGPAAKSAPPSAFTPIVIEEPSLPQGETLQVTIGEVSIEVKPGFNSTLFSEVVRTLKTLC